MTIASPNPLNIAPLPQPPTLLTYEAYLAEGEVNRRYDILEGVRYMTNPTRYHQFRLRKIARAFEDYEETSGQGQCVVAPCDVLIRRRPLRTRQPDVLFISNERLAQNPPDNDPTPLSPAPELVVEILLPSDTPSVLTEKLTDYASVDVLECWVISPTLRTVEVLQRAGKTWASIATYRMGETAQSLLFPDLKVQVAAIFA